MQAEVRGITSSSQALQDLCYFTVLGLFSVTDRHDALFVVGSLDETLELRGLRYHPIDIETSVSRAHRSIAERSVSVTTDMFVNMKKRDLSWSAPFLPPPVPSLRGPTCWWWRRS